MDQYIGKLLDDRYEILDVIGVGGMAVVYKAYCHRLHRFVAIKVLKRDLAADAEFRRRFHEEAQAVAMLSHPNIVSVYDVSRGDDLDYIVMELIDGITLKQYMQKKDGSLNWRESLYFITQIMRALSHAHSRGIIHRDIKPQNIMVLRDGSVKVADFGIARIMSAAQNTLTQETLGSVHYISPEQARGSHIDARADIYSAGVVLYEMLTGRLPFDGDSPVSVAIQHISATPLAPRELDPDIPEGLEEITMKAMAARLDRRYVSAEAMLRDLEEFRKDPQVVFHYDLASFHGAQPVPDEPTQVLETTGTIPRRPRPQPRPQARPRPAPPRYDEPEDDYDEPPHRRTLVIPIVLIVFLAGAGLFLWLTFFSDMFSSAPELDVPDLRGLTVEEADADEDLRFKIVEASTAPSDEYPEGQIVSQDPQSGEKAKEGSTIRVTVSSGKEPVKMVDVSGLRYEDAVQILQSKGLKVDTPEYAADDEVEKGYVISYTPLEGVELAPGDTVHLVVSTGKKVKSVIVPTLVGQSLDNARKMITDIGLNVASVTEVYSSEAAGRVTYQSIASGTEVDEGTSIVLNVSKGPEAPTLHNKTIDVTLPTDRESVEVKITVDGAVKYDNTVSTSVENFAPTVSGSGVQHVCVYLDGALVDEFDKDFGQ